MSKISELKLDEDDEDFISCIEDEDELKEWEECTLSLTNLDVKMHFKGVSITGPGNYGMSGIGVVMEKPGNASTVRVQKKLDFFVQELVAEYLALLDGLSLAIQHDIKHVFAVTDSQLLCNQIMCNERVDSPLLVALRQRILEQADNLQSFVLKHVPAFELQTPLHLAQVAVGIVSFPVEGEDVTETCSICCEEKLSSMMFRIKCSHKFCSRCMKTYVEGKLRSTQVPITCPQLGCKYSISTAECESFLPVTLLESLERVLAEADIFNSDKVYCPSPNCSDEELMAYPNQQWAWDTFESFAMIMDVYSEQERSQLTLIQRFLAQGFNLTDQRPCQSPPQFTDSYADVMKDLHQLPWLEEFASVISDNYYEDYIQ